MFRTHKTSFYYEMRVGNTAKRSLARNRSSRSFFFLYPVSFIHDYGIISDRTDRRVRIM